MDANIRQGGIQQLLAAEQEAQQIVNAARSGNFFIYFFFGVVSWAQYTTGGARAYAICYSLHPIIYVTTTSLGCNWL
jgi:hypothetical protein